MTDDPLEERPPIIVYSRDLERLRAFGLANGLGDSAVALRALLDLVDGIADENGALARAISAEFVLDVIGKGIPFRGESDPRKIAQLYRGHHEGS